MCYEASIASAGGDNTTLAKSFTISLENTTAKRKIPCQFFRILGRAQHRGRFFVVPTI
jgi:hypothetical protein